MTTRDRFFSLISARDDRINGIKLGEIISYKLSQFEKFYSNIEKTKQLLSTNFGKNLSVTPSFDFYNKFVIIKVRDSSSKNENSYSNFSFSKDDSLRFSFNLDDESSKYYDFIADNSDFFENFCDSNNKSNVILNNSFYSLCSDKNFILECSSSSLVIYFRNRNIYESDFFYMNRNFVPLKVEFDLTDKNNGNISSDLCRYNVSTQSKFDTFYYKRVLKRGTYKNNNVNLFDSISFEENALPSSMTSDIKSFQYIK